MKYILLLSLTIISCVPYSLMQHQGNPNDYDRYQQREEDKCAVREELARQNAESQDSQTQRDINVAIERARLQK